MTTLHKLPARSTVQQQAQVQVPAPALAPTAPVVEQKKPAATGLDTQATQVSAQAVKLAEQSRVSDPTRVRGAGLGAATMLRFGLADVKKADAPRTITADQLDFSKGAPVVSGAQKFILPVPALKDGGEPLVYPAGTRNKEGQDISGKPIADWQGKPIGDKGVVFFNHKDQSWQAVKADNLGVVIMNQVTEEQARKLQQKIGADPSKLTLQQFKDVLSFAATELGLGDMYNSDRNFISSKMNAMEKSSTGVAQYGLHRRDDRDVCSALFIPGKGEFQGPAATPQKFEDGAVIIKQGDSTRLIQPDAFLQTYTRKDGTALDLASIPRHAA